MGKKISIQIPEPCHEDWNKMTPQERGRHCQVCEKTVVDFTDKTDSFIVKTLKSDDNLCGRFRNDQLNRPMRSGRRYSLIPPLAASFILPLAMLATTSAYAQGQPKSFARNTNYVSLNIGSKQQQAYKDIKGVVKDTAGNPLPGVRITVLESNDQIQTDNKGTYRLRVRIGQTLRFSYYLHLTEEIQVSAEQDIYNFVLTYNPTHLPEVVVCAKAPIMEVGVLGNPFSEIVPEQQLQDSTAVQVVRGNILDDTDFPLPGAYVLVQGTDRRTQTDFDGNFEIAAKPGETLEIKFIGYISKSVVVTKENHEIKLALDLNLEEVEEVIFVGIPIWREPSRPVNFRSSYNPSTNFNGNPQLQEDRARYANTIEFQRLEREKKKAARKARKKRK